jgi:cell division septum initiation protein DivIVA
MKDEFSELFESAKALVTYIDKEDVFDKAADMGCGGFDTYQSDAFYDLIAEARKAITEVEKDLKASE